MKFYRKSILISFCLYFVFTLLWNINLYFLKSHNTNLNYIFNLLYAIVYLFGGLVSIVYASVFGIKSNLGKILLFLGSGLFFYALALGIWFYYNMVHDDIPYPSMADAAFLIFYPLMFVGAIYLVKIYITFITKAVIRDSVIISIITFIAVFYFHTRIDLSPDISLSARIVSIAYPFFDVVIMSVGLIAIRIGGGKLHPSFYLFSLGLLVQGAGDLIFDFRESNNLYWNGDISDTIFLLSGFILSISLFEIIHNLTQVTNAPVTRTPIEQNPALNQTSPTSPTSPEK